MRIAAIDLGSNSFHLLVAEAHQDGTFEPLAREKETLRLGNAVAKTGEIGADLRARGIAVVARFRALAEPLDVDEYVACATSAVRDATDSALLVDGIEDEVGIPVRVISGHEEARLIFTALRASVVLDPSPALAVDLGGGSLKLMVGDQSDLRWSASLALGVGRLTSEVVRSDPPSRADLRRLHKRVGEGLAGVAAAVTRYRPRMLVGSSGTLGAVARMADARRNGSVPPSVNQLTVRRKDVVALCDEIVDLPADARVDLPGADAKRADQLPAATVILTEIMDRFGFDEMTTSEWALREGMVLDAIGHHPPADWADNPAALRHDAVSTLGRRFGWDEAHAHKVAELALRLFDETAGIHDLPVEDRELLELGALLHDIGEHVSTVDHDPHGAYLVTHGRLRGFSPKEVTVLAALVRFHRRGTPKAATFAPFGELSTSRQQRVTKLAALLRLADALDRSHAGTVHDVAVRDDGKRLTVVVEAATEADLEAWAVRRKRSLFERLFDRAVEFETAGNERNAAAG